MDIKDFLNLSKLDQNNAVLKNGTIVINYNQGDKVVQLYKLQELFVTVTTKTNGDLQLHPLNDVADLKLYNPENSQGIINPLST